MATISSSVSGSTTTYTITDQQGNVITVTAPPPGQGVVTFSGSGQVDAQQLLATLLSLLVANGTSPRPQVFVNSTASFFS